MCELLGMSSSYQTVINVSLSALAMRGENPRLHGDGWGIAFHVGDDVRLIKDAGEAKQSKWVEFVKQQEIECHDIIAHIRKSTVGNISYSNTHPFIRELYGKVHSFAHNGTYHNIFNNPKFKTYHFHPIGETDSELSFCFLMDRMHDLWTKYKDVPPIEERYKVVQSFAEEMRSLGPANFLYSDGETLFAHGHERHDPLTDKITWPGLHYKNCYASDSDSQLRDSFKSGFAIRNQDQNLMLFASVPLDEGTWIPLKCGELIAVNRGESWPPVMPQF
jgi:predicted glutamine amidotransferase